MEIVTFPEQKGGAVGRGPRVGALLKGEYILDKMAMSWKSRSKNWANSLAR